MYQVQVEQIIQVPYRTWTERCSAVAIIL